MSFSGYLSIRQKKIWKMERVKMGGKFGGIFIMGNVNIEKLRVRLCYWSNEVERLENHLERLERRRLEAKKRVVLFKEWIRIKELSVSGGKE